MELDAILDSLSDEEQIELLELLEEEENYRNTHLLYEFTPYSKQREFIDAGHDYPERCFMAGNQLGKSFTGAAEVAFHLTGRYPGTKGYPADGKYGGEWKGKRFYEPVVFWIGGETNETVTKTTQRILCGRIEENDEPGYGSIPKEDIISWKKSPFFPNLVDHLLVKHHTPEGVEDGISICYFKPYPYYLLNRTDENNGEMPTQPLAYYENPEVPQANAYMLEAATAAVKEVATLGVDAEAVNGGQVAYDTVNQLNMRADLETYVFQDNLATAMRRDGEIYQSIVNDIYDVPRNVTITLEDGSEKEVQLMAEVVDLATGERQVLNDIRGRYECYTDVGPSFQSMKQQNRAEILELLGKTPQGTPEYQLLLLQYFTLLDGKGVEMMRDYANKQLIQMGVKKPETPEEQQWFVEAQQAKQGQQDPAMVQAQGVLLQGQAELAKAQNQTLSLQIDAAKVEAQNQLNAAKIAEIFNNMDLSKQSEFREFLKTVASFQQDRSEDARANAELLLKGNEQTHKQRMDIANILQSQRQNQPSGSVAETPQ
ncbi:hypothetical protein CIX96_03970 [Salmonella enterica]|nr:hypothetical protein [Salmonella enterica]